MKLILLSGGWDSSSLAWMERPELALTIDYGQLSASGEVRAAREICAEVGMSHEIVRVDCHALGSGDLAGVPSASIAPAPEWWPFRNQLLLTLAAMHAIKVGADTLLIGTVATDAFHADGRGEFIAAFNSLLKTQEGDLRVVAPALSMTSADLVRRSGIPFGVLSWAHSCHVSEWACGGCRGCLKQIQTRISLGYESA